MFKGQNWTPIYIAVIIAIAAILIMSVIKPMFQASASTAIENIGFLLF